MVRCLPSVSYYVQPWGAEHVTKLPITTIASCYNVGSRSFGLSGRRAMMEELATGCRVLQDRRDLDTALGPFSA